MITRYFSIYNHLFCLDLRQKFPTNQEWSTWFQKSEDGNRIMQRNGSLGSDCYGFIMRRDKKKRMCMALFIFIFSCFSLFQYLSTLEISRLIIRSCGTCFSANFLSTVPVGKRSLWNQLNLFFMSKSYNPLTTERDWVQVLYYPC